MMSNLKIGTRLALAFGGIALLVLLMTVMALSGLGAAEQALQGGAAGQPKAALAQLQAILAEPEQPGTQAIRARARELQAAAPHSAGSAAKKSTRR